MGMRRVTSAVRMRYSACLAERLTLGVQVGALLTPLHLHDPLDECEMKAGTRGMRASMAMTYARQMGLTPLHLHDPLDECEMKAGARGMRASMAMNYARQMGAKSTSWRRSMRRSTSSAASRRDIIFLTPHLS